MGKGFRGHVLRIYLNTKLYQGLIDLQSDRKLGRSYAGLLAYSEGLYRLGFLSKAEYLRCKEKYSIPLDKEPQQLTLAETPKQNELNDLDKLLGEAIAQWGFHPKQKWRDYWIRKAVENGDLPNAKKLLAFVEENKK